MSGITRRGALGAAALAMPVLASARGVEGQRKADLGNGTFVNPVMAGDHPDPSVLRVGDDFYMTFSSFDSYPGLVLWHSRDLVNWEPKGPTLFNPVGSVWAPDRAHEGALYLFPGAEITIWSSMRGHRGRGAIPWISIAASIQVTSSARMGGAICSCRAATACG